MFTPRFIPSGFDGMENIEEYIPGGYHPISIGDTFDHGRFRVLHKLGSGGASTVWLARDQREGKEKGKLVALKAILADLTPSMDTNEIPELAIPKLLASLPPSESVEFMTVDHHFFVQGPNGTNLFLVLPFSGPSIFAMCNSPRRTSNYRRLSAGLARQVAKQTAMAIYHMHCAGIVHGDLTTSNILFRLQPHVIEWSDDEVYTNLGDPETEILETCNGEPVGIHAPSLLVAPIENSDLSQTEFLQDSIVINDFGQSYIAASPWPSYQPGTAVHYQSPEAYFENRVSFETDIWALGCTIFEIRTGGPLFESFLGTDIEVLKGMVELLGRLPDPWWNAFEKHTLWFEEDGNPKSIEAQKRAGVLEACKSSIRERLQEIGEREKPPSEDEGPMIEKCGVQLSEEEIELLGNLLESMLKYRPEERISITDVIQHPWFS